MRYMHAIMQYMHAKPLGINQATGYNQVTGYANQHYSAPVPNQDKLAGLWQKRHSA